MPPSSKTRINSPHGASPAAAAFRRRLWSAPPGSSRALAGRRMRYVTDQLDRRRDLVRRSDSDPHPVVQRREGASDANVALRGLGAERLCRWRPKIDEIRPAVGALKADGIKGLFKARPARERPGAHARDIGLVAERCGCRRKVQTAEAVRCPDAGIAQALRKRGRGNGITDRQAGKAVGLGERAEHQNVRAGAKLPIALRPARSSYSR